MKERDRGIDKFPSQHQIRDIDCVCLFVCFSSNDEVDKYIAALDLLTLIFSSLVLLILAMLKS